MDPGPKQTVLRALALVRIQDGEALLKTGQPTRRGGAIYIAGYGIECALKARLCVERGEAHLNARFYHHDLERLAEGTQRWRALPRLSPLRHRLSWLQSVWDVSMRYEARAHDPQEVLLFINRARELVRWLGGQSD